MILRGANRSTQRETCLSATLSTTKPVSVPLCLLQNLSQCHFVYYKTLTVFIFFPLGYLEKYLKKKLTNRRINQFSERQVQR